MIIFRWNSTAWIRVFNLNKCTLIQCVNHYYLSTCKRRRPKQWLSASIDQTVHRLLLPLIYYTGLESRVYSGSVQCQCKSSPPVVVDLLLWPYQYLVLLMPYTNLSLSGHTWIISIPSKVCYQWTRRRRRWRWRSSLLRPNDGLPVD